MKDIKIIVVTHKQYTMPQDKNMYYPVQSGSAIYEDLGIQRDDEGENISKKNPTYNELCPLYWAWKNLDSDYLGICHYRRLFSDSKKNGRTYNDILCRDTAEKILDEYDAILTPPKKYYGSSVEKHYVNSYAGYKEIHQKDIEVLRNVLTDKYPAYIDSFNHVMASSCAHMLNMCIMKRVLYDKYLTFVYDVLGECEIRLKDRKDQGRYIAALSEFLLDTWINKNQIKYTELGLVELEHTPLPKRVIDVMKRKFKSRN